MERPHPDTIKMKLAEKIERDVMTFISNGGMITVVPEGVVSEKDKKTPYNGEPFDD